jgi:hypothetical protein
MICTKEEVKSEAKTKDKIDKNLMDNEDLFDNQLLNKTVLETSNSLLSFKFSSFSLKRYSYRHRFKTKERISKISLYSSLTN